MTNEEATTYAEEHNVAILAEPTANGQLTSEALMDLPTSMLASGMVDMPGEYDDELDNEPPVPKTPPAPKMPPMPKMPPVPKTLPMPKMPPVLKTPPSKASKSCAAKGAAAAVSQAGAGGAAAVARGGVKVMPMAPVGGAIILPGSKMTASVAAMEERNSLEKKHKRSSKGGRGAQEDVVESIEQQEPAGREKGKPRKKKSKSDA